MLGKHAILSKVEAVENQIREVRRHLDYTTLEYPVDILVSKLDDYILIPAYQRPFVWDIKRKARFLESVIMGLPIPVMFFCENEKDGTFEVLDGSQRLRTLAEFINGALQLSGLDVLSELSGMSFKDFGVPRQRKIGNTTTKSFVLREGAKGWALAELFERINTTALPITQAQLAKALQHLRA